VLAAVAFVLLLALLVGRVLSSPKVRTTVAGWIERAAREQGLELEVGSLSWGLLPPRAILREVTLTDSELAVRIDRLEVELTRIRVARRIIELETIAADGIRVRLDGLPRKAVPRGRSLVRIVVRHLDLRDIAVEGVDLPGHIDLAVDGANVVWTTEQGTPSGFLSARRVRLSVPGLEPLDAAVQARLVLEEGLRFPAWRLHDHGLSLEGTAAIAGGALRLDAAGTVDLARVSSLIRDPGRLLGTARVAAAVDTGAEEMVRLELSSPQVTAAGFTRGARRPPDHCTGPSDRRARRRHLPRRPADR
jgi:hypothetical protein